MPLIKNILTKWIHSMETQKMLGYSQLSRGRTGQGKTQGKRNDWEASVLSSATSYQWHYTTLYSNLVGGSLWYKGHIDVICPWKSKCLHMENLCFKYTWAEQVIFHNFTARYLMYGIVKATWEKQRYCASYISICLVVMFGWNNIHS